MKFNLLMPMRSTKHYDDWIDGGHLVDVARAGEDAGFDGIALTEHPFPDDDWLAHGGHHAFDPFVALSFMASATRRISLVTFVLVAGYRNPYVTAKALASLDRLSGGRAIAGMAAGYLRPEFDAVGANWTRRGALFDEALDAIRSAWTGESVERDGAFPAHRHTQLPAPVTPGGPPIWIGGNSEAARRRAAQRGEGWMPINQGKVMAGITKTPPLESIAELRTLIADVRRRRAEVDGGPFDVCFSPFGDRSDIPSWSKQIRADFAAYEDAGVTWLTIEPHSRNLGQFRDAVARMGEEVVSAV